VSTKEFNAAVGEQIGPLLEGILRNIDKARKSPHPKVNAQTEFAARFAVEKAESVEFLVAQETKDMRQQLKKALAEVKTLGAQVERRVSEVESRPVQVVQTAPVAPPPRPMAFTLSVTKLDDGGLMKTVIAKAGDRTVEFTIDRTGDGFPSFLTAEEKAT
jgi:hypothetical protein